MCLFAGNIAVARVTKPNLPLVEAKIAVLFLVMYVPDVATTMPRLPGYAKQRVQRYTWPNMRPPLSGPSSSGSGTAP